MVGTVKGHTFMTICQPNSEASFHALLYKALTILTVGD